MKKTKLYLRHIVAFSIIALIITLLYTSNRLQESINPPIFAPVVGIFTGDRWRGSGFFVNKRHIMTASHVLSKPTEPDPNIPIPLVTWENAKIGDKVTVLWVGGDGRRFEAEVIWQDIDKDIAILKTNEDIPNVSYFPIEWGVPRLHEDVSIVGVVDDDGIVSNGDSISIPTRVAKPAKWMRWTGNEADPDGVEQYMLLLAASGAPGTSGSAIVNKEGKVIAIHVGHLFRVIGVSTPLWKAREDILKQLSE